VARRRAPYGSKKRKRGRPKKKQARPNKKTKHVSAEPKGGGGSDDKNKKTLENLASDTPGNFFSPEIDLDAYNYFQHMSLTHWGLQVGVCLMGYIALEKASYGLMLKVSALISTINGLGFFSLPSYTPCPVRREVVVGAYEAADKFIFDKHDDAVGVSASAAANWNDYNRIVLISHSEYTNNAKFILSPTARRLLCTDEDIAAFSTGYNAHNKLVQDRLETSDYHATAHANIVTMTKYNTKHAGPLSSCVEDITLHPLRGGPLRCHVYQTLWFGNTGYDGICVQEFVPLDKVSPTAKATIIRSTKRDEERAAQALIGFVN